MRNGHSEYRNELCEKGIERGREGGVVVRCIPLNKGELNAHPVGDGCAETTGWTIGIRKSTLAGTEPATAY